MPSNHAWRIETLSGYVINAECVLCGLCVPVCPEDCIEVIDLRYIIDSPACTECDECLRVCPVDAIHRAEETDPQED